MIQRAVFVVVAITAVFSSDATNTTSNTTAATSTAASTNGASNTQANVNASGNTTAPEVSVDPSTTKASTTVTAAASGTTTAVAKPKKVVSGSMTLSGISLENALKLRGHVQKALAAFLQISESDIVMGDPIEVARRLTDERRLAATKIKMPYTMTLDEEAANQAKAAITQAASDPAALLDAVKAIVKNDPELKAAMESVTIEVAVPTITDATTTTSAISTTAVAEDDKDDDTDSGCGALSTAFAFVSVASATLATFW